MRVKVEDKQYAAHRLAWFYVHGEWPFACIDHIDGNPLNDLSILTDIKRIAMVMKDGAIHSLAPGLRPGWGASGDLASTDPERVWAASAGRWVESPELA